MADRNELLAGIADHIGVLERRKRGTPAWWKRVQDEQRPILGMPVRNPDGTYSMPTEPPEFPTDGKGAFVFHGFAGPGLPIATFETEDPYKNPDGTRSVTPHIEEDLLIEPTADGTNVTKITARQRRPKTVREAVAQLREGLPPPNSPDTQGEVPNW